MNPFKSIEDRHGVNEPGYEPSVKDAPDPEPDRHIRPTLAQRGQQLQEIGNALSRSGASMMGFGCMIWLVFIAIILCVALAQSLGH